MPFKSVRLEVIAFPFMSQIHPVVDLPGVGQNLQDHIATVGLTWLTRPSENAAYNPIQVSRAARISINSLYKVKCGF